MPGKQDFVSPMQEAFINAAAESKQHQGFGPVTMTTKVVYALIGNKPKQVRSWDAKLSYRTAQRLKQDGVL